MFEWRVDQVFTHTTRKVAPMLKLRSLMISAALSAPLWLPVVAEAGNRRY